MVREPEMPEGKLNRKGHRYLVVIAPVMEIRGLLRLPVRKRAREGEKDRNRKNKDCLMYEDCRNQDRAIEIKRALRLYVETGTGSLREKEKGKRKEKESPKYKVSRDQDRVKMKMARKAEAPPCDPLDS